MRLHTMITLIAVGFAGCSASTGEVDIVYGDAEAWFQDAGLVIDNAAPNATSNNALRDAGLGFDSAGGGDAEVLDPGIDSDGDGLSDMWEVSAGDASRLDPQSADSDGDGVEDGDEDYDDDRLTNAEEFAVSQWPVASGVLPNPFRIDMLVELDAMNGKTVSDAVLASVAATYAALPTPIGVVVLRDEMSIAPFDLDGSFEQRHAFFAAHGPTFDDGPTRLPVSQMVHVAVVTRRSDNTFRGAEVVTDGGGDVSKSGVLVFYDALNDLHPQCGDTTSPDITLDEALAGALSHELGHVLQLGHDTVANGGENFHNVMSVPTTCAGARARFRGEGNSDPSLGATETVGASRFSAQAAALIRFGDRLSVNTSELVNDGVGLEM